MAIDLCNPCSSQCLFHAYNSEASFRQAVLAILCGISGQFFPTSVVRINGTYNGSNQQVLDAPGVGFKYRIRSLYMQVEDAATDVQFFSRSGGGVNTALTPNFDDIANAGAIGNTNFDGWFETLNNEKLVVTSSAPVDLLGTAVIIPA